MDNLEQIAVKVEAGDMEAVESLVKECIEQKITADDILSQGLVGGMLSIGVKFKNNTVFIPEVLIAARAMKAGLALIKPLMKDDSASTKAKILIGTVKGDLHDIGKNIVCAMLEGAGFIVIDLGIDVPKEKFVEAIQNENPQVVGLSALLTTTMSQMKEVIDATAEAGLRDKVKIIIGGAPVSQEFSDEINADAYASDAGVAVDIVNQLLR